MQNLLAKAGRFIVEFTGWQKPTFISNIENKCYMRIKGVIDYIDSKLPTLRSQNRDKLVVARKQLDVLVRILKAYKDQTATNRSLI